MIKKRVGLDSLDLGVPVAVASMPQQPEKPAEPKAGSRPNVKQQTLYTPHVVYEALREIAFHERVKIHDLLREGVDHVLRTRGKPGWTDSAE
jgi:hypothetical protein